MPTITLQSDRQERRILLLDNQKKQHSEEHHLTAISCHLELRELRDLYLHNWPEHCVGYLTLDNYLHWLQKIPEMKNLKIYTLDDDWRSNGLHLIVRHRSAVINVISELNLQKEYDISTSVFYMPAAKAAKLDINCPAGYTIRPISVTDAALIDKLWIYRYQGSLFYIQRLIELNISMGVYTAETNEPVAWCMRNQVGFLGVLHVKYTHKRLGLATLVVSATARRVAREIGQDITVCVSKDNMPSCGVFNKLGFSVIDSAYYMRTFPTEEGINWPDGE